MINSNARHLWHALSLLAILLVLAGGVMSCQYGGSDAPPFQLYILPIGEAQAISHQATTSEYEQWLKRVKLNRAGLVLQAANIAAVNDDYSHTLVLEMTGDASREIIALVEPDADADHLLSGEYSIACPYALTPENAFVVRLSGDRVLGGTIRCPTAEYHTHPDMYVATRIGYIVLRIDNCDQAVLERIVSALR